VRYDSPLTSLYVSGLSSALQCKSVAHDLDVTFLAPLSVSNTSSYHHIGHASSLPGTQPTPT
jgi:hypothetical protein